MKQFLTIAALTAASIVNGCKNDSPKVYTALNLKITIPEYGTIHMHIPSSVMSEISNSNVKSLRAKDLHYCSDDCLSDFDFQGKTADGLDFILNFVDNDRNDTFELNNLSKMSKTSMDGKTKIEADSIALKKGIKSFLTPGK